MKATELRIGNLFFEESSKEIIEVIWLEKTRIIFSGMFLNNWQAKPIKLTPEWLVNFGFEKIDYHRFKIKPSKFEWYYTYSTHDNAFRFYVEDTIVCLNVIFYVHQLQNLYFALTGNELELKK